MSRGLFAIGLSLALLAAPGPAAVADAEPAKSAVPEDPVAVALTAALQTVHDRFAPGAKPVPEKVKQALTAEYGAELERARYVVSRLAISVLEAIDQFQGTSLRNGQHAITVDDLIVFASEPSDSELSLWMWAHELHHVRQYRVLGGIDAFAAAYLRDCEAIEKEADERANRALGTKIQPRHCL